MQKFPKVLSGDLGSDEYRLKAKSGKFRWIRSSSRPVFEGDLVVGLMGVFVDINEQKKMDGMFRQVRKLEAIGTLAGGIAHQFNNALYAITGNIDLLEMDFPGDETVAGYAGEMKTSAHRMAHLTAQLLAYARGGKYQAETISLRDFVKETIPLVRHAIGSDIHVAIDLPRDVLNIETDTTQMRMVLSAVLTNASEAMEGILTCSSASAKMGKSWSRVPAT